jgi:hypothetical protein
MAGIVTAMGGASTRFVVISCLELSVAARTPTQSPATTKPASTKRTRR